MINNLVSPIIELREQYFTPGNIVQAYNGLDIVHDYRTISSEGRWAVKVSEVKQDENGNWKVIGRKRWHSTEPSSSYKVIATNVDVI